MLLGLKLAAAGFVVLCLWAGFLWNSAKS
jgi:hypothetical protein